MAGTVESLEELSPAVRDAMLDLVGRIGACKNLLGRRFADWCTGAPTLEASVAAAAMSQEELGHSRVFLGLARGVQDNEAGETAGEGADLAPSCLAEPFADWLDFVASGLSVDAGVTMLLEAVSDSDYTPLRQRARKALIEEEFHRIYERDWVAKFLAEGGRLAAELREKIARSTDSVRSWLVACEADLGRLEPLGVRPVSLGAELEGRIWGDGLDR